jgi:hypothetical protein
MRSRLNQVEIVFILVVCLVCPLVELFDHWDHTMQSGNDTEYTLVVVALCAGVAYSFARFIFKSVPLGFVAKIVFPSYSQRSFFSASCSFTSLLFDAASPPPLPLRI